MTCGMKQAGITVLAGLDHDYHCEETYIKITITLSLFLPTLPE